MKRLSSATGLGVTKRGSAPASLLSANGQSAQKLTEISIPEDQTVEVESDKRSAGGTPFLYFISISVLLFTHIFRSASCRE